MVSHSFSWKPLLSVLKAPKVTVQYKTKVDDKYVNDTKEQKLQKRWRSAIEADKIMPEKRFPVVIQTDTALPSPVKLQGIFDLPSAPPTTTTKVTSLSSPDLNFDMAGEEEVVICGINREQVNIIREGWVSEEVVVWFEGQTRFAMILLSAKPNPTSEAKSKTLDNSVPI
ncbi:hypothetical protein F5Y09DRAFT_345299 [Xylaria sp. FL1042]|nr:hypothetical protein F5Y09DRAFT_345299 [Xylaria sp. FL1042]